MNIDQFSTLERYVIGTETYIVLFEMNGYLFVVRETDVAGGGDPIPLTITKRV